MFESVRLFLVYNLFQLIHLQKYFVFLLLILRLLLVQTSPKVSHLLAAVKCCNLRVDQDSRARLKGLFPDFGSVCWYHVSSRGVVTNRVDVTAV